MRVGGQEEKSQLAACLFIIGELLQGTSGRDLEFLLRHNHIGFEVNGLYFGC